MRPLSVFAALMFCAACSSPQTSDPVEEPRSRPAAVVVVTIDTLRWDMLGFAGHGELVSPFLDRLARKAVVFNEAYAPSSWTPPSMASLMTSRYPTSHGFVFGAREEGSGLNQPVLAEGLTTLAEAMQAAGYRTIGVTSNPNLTRQQAFAQGFDHYGENAMSKSARQVNEEVRRLLEEAFGPKWRQTWKQEKTFLWIHYVDPHHPYIGWEPWILRYAPDFDPQCLDYPSNQPFEELARLWFEDDLNPSFRHRIVPLYQAEVMHVDRHLQALDAELGLTDGDVLLMVTSDHGEEIVDHGELGHSYSLYEEVVRIPFVVSWPGTWPEGVVRDTVASLLDIFPTLAEVLELQAQESIQGVSLQGVLRGEKAPRQRDLFFELHPPKPVMTAVLRGHWKLVREEEPQGRAGLFHLKTDPAEHFDARTVQPAVAAALERSIVEWRSSLPLPPENEWTPQVDRETEDALRALGYLDNP